MKIIIDFILRLVLCTFTFHAPSETPVQSHKAFHIYACKRCSNLFCKSKTKVNKKIK